MSSNIQDPFELARDAQIEAMEQRAKANQPIAEMMRPDAGTPLAGVVVCHPHPMYGGTRESHVVRAVARALVAERMRMLVDSSPLSWLEQDWPLSASFGIAEAERGDAPAHDVSGFGLVHVGLLLHPRLAAAPLHVQVLLALPPERPALLLLFHDVRILLQQLAHHDGDIGFVVFRHDFRRDRTMPKL